MTISCKNKDLGKDSTLGDNMIINGDTLDIVMKM